ncbi:hypothetical protein [Pseudomonas putida]|uniref:hypothetical protein n=1 Tax=Pseudomonas putida TaxID=303 RepID=UPI0018D7F20B|nr:hypothetical protein [Pseudomonas putida]MBH3412520.1 hypothetical protein [Pseudomonas putida]
MKLNNTLPEVLHKIVALLLIALPMVSLALNLISWLRFGVDVPFLDDMRQYAQDSAGRLDFRYISTPANDTLYPVGLILDGLAFRFLDGNSVAYQAISMLLVLGGILYLQWKLLGLCCNSWKLRAVAFSLTLFMLQPDSYWGWQNMAFHQAVPVLCSLWIVYLILSNSNSLLSALAVFFLSLISGFTYTSGAFANLALLAALIVLIVFQGGQSSSRLKFFAKIIAIPTVLTVAAQLWVIVWVQHGTHRADAPMAYPWESDFWYYLLGKIGRAFMFPMNLPEVSLYASAAVLAVSTGLGLFAIALARKSQRGSVMWNASVAYLSIYGVILLYLFIVAAGRANLRPLSIESPTDIFIYGYGRFHFFWVCILWPWIAALILGWWSDRNPEETSRPETSFIVLLVLCVLVYGSNIMGHAAFYKTTKDVRVEIVTCLSQGVSRGVPFECADLHPGINMLKVFYSSLFAGASYTDLIQVAPVPLGTTNPPPVFDLLTGKQSIKYFNATAEDVGQSGVRLTTAVDPMLEISLGASDVLKSCAAMQVSGAYHLDEQNYAQIFYLPAGQKSFAEANSVGQKIPAGDSEFSFRITSKKGFEGLIRFDPVISYAPITLKRLEVRCVQGPLGGVNMH